MLFDSVYSSTSCTRVMTFTMHKLSAFDSVKPPSSLQALILTETLQSANEVFNEAREQRYQQQLHQQQQQQRKKRRYTPSAQVGLVIELYTNRQRPQHLMSYMNSDPEIRGKL